MSGTEPEVLRIPAQSVDPSVKNYHWLDLDLALLEANERAADPSATGPLLGQPRGPAVRDPCPLRRAGLNHYDTIMVWL